MEFLAKVHKKAIRLPVSMDIKEGQRVLCRIEVLKPTEEKELIKQSGWDSEFE